MKKRTLSLVALILALVFAFSFAGFSAFAEDDTAVNVEVEDTADHADETESDTAAADKKEDESKEETTEVDRTEGIINLAVGGVLLIALVVLCIVFRKKIPGWLRSLKSECKKVVWCPKDQLKNSTIVVLVTIVALALVIVALDYGLAEAFDLLKTGVQKLITKK